jgi:hypothetical protein
MPKPLDYRRRLLAIVDAFMDPSDGSHTRACRRVNRLYHDPRRRLQTIDDLVWGGFVSELTDSVFYEQLEYLQQTRETLVHGSPELHRAYLSYDFRSDFTAVERDWHAHLCELAAWLQTQPFPWLQSDPLPLGDESAAQSEYERRVQAITALSARTPPPAHVGEEKLYHFVTRTDSAVLAGINPWSSTRYGYLAAAVPYTAYQWNPADPNDRFRPIDAGTSVAWAVRALQAITLHGWVWMTWQVTASSYLVSLH